MTGTGSYTYEEVDPSKKDAVWANRIIEIHRMNWRRLVNVIRGIEDRNLLYSNQPLTKVAESFQDAEFKRDVEFIPLPIMEAFVNAVVEELTKRPPRTELKAIDPTAISEKEKDVNLLKNRRVLERDISTYRQQVGEPPYKMPYSNFNGNVKEFDNMGLDENDPEDINFYVENFQKLMYEIGGQALLDSVLKVNKFDESTLRKIVKDIFAFKAICTQVYVDKITGEIKTRYVDPTICYGVFGDTNDGKNDACRGWQDNITVMEWLQMVGNEFDWYKEWRYLLWGINFCNGTKFTGFIRDGVTYDCCFNGQWTAEMGLDGVEQNMMDWSQAYTYKVFSGYIEWRSIDATATYLKSNSRPNYAEPIPYHYELKKKKEIKEYYKESFYQQQWYSSYFLATSSLTQWIYSFQKVYLQQLEGANDEYSNGTLCYYQEEGKSAVEIAKPYLQPANFAYYRMLWLIYKTKPDQEEYLLNELITLAKGLKREFPQMAGVNNTPSFDSILDQVIQYQRKSHIRIRVFPEVEGRTIPQLPPEGKRPGTGGLDPVAIAMQSVTQWAEMQIGIKIGINPMRLGANPPSRESTESEMNTIQYSFNTTGYIYRMVQYLKEHIAICILNYSQDIIKYKESLPYKWLMRIVGNESLEYLKVLDKFCAHRMGIFIWDYNRIIEKDKIMQAANIALAKGTLRQDEWFILNSTDDPKRANAILSRMMRIREKKQAEQQMQQLQMQDQIAQKQYEREKDLIMTKGEIDLQVEQIRAKSFIASAQIQAENKVNVKELQVASEQPKIAAKAEAQKSVEQNKKNLEEQKPLDEIAA
jgi:hypothetical protein